MVSGLAGGPGGCLYALYLGRRQGRTKGPGSHAGGGLQMALTSLVDDHLRSAEYKMES